jgi:hypothetical protein
MGRLALPERTRPKLTKAVIALHQGFDYQARWFWNEALRLLRSEPVLERVAIEAPAPRGFDDIVSHPVRPRDQDVWGEPVGIDGFQAKFHVDHSKVIRATDLADPDFITAKSSLLQRLQAAAGAAEAEGRHGRFTLITPWRIDHQDLLGQLRGTDGQLRLSVLFDGTSDRSETGKVRKLWRDHLHMADDESLRELVKHLRILERDVVATNRELERELETAGLVPVPPEVVTHPYVDLIHGHVKLGELEFDATALRRTLTAAGLWRTGPMAPDAHRRLAIRSRRLGAVHLEDEANDLLDLVPLFHDRAVAHGVDWNGDVAAQIERFLSAHVQTGERYRLYLDAHGAIAFAAGWQLHRADVTPMQTIDGRLVPWPPSGVAPDGPQWHIRQQTVGSSAGPDVALALSVTHDIHDDVLAFVAGRLPSVNLVLGLSAPSIGRTSVRDGAHANDLAVEAVQTVRKQRPRDGRPSRVHLFAAGPNGLMFQLGRNGRPLGETTVYEFDFENPHRGYAPAINIPMPKEAP